MNYYQKTAQEVVVEFSTDIQKGLSTSEAKDRIVTFGYNELAQKRQETIFDIFVRQFKSPLIYILIFAAALVLTLGAKIDALVILAVIIFNSIVGTIQEGKARNSLSRLKSLTKHKAVVRRDEEEFLISAEEVVCGDVLILHEGDKIVADARIIVCEGLKVDESILTGESQAVVKTSDVISHKNLVVGDQKNMVFAGTSVVGGAAEGVVTETGINSQIGKISKELLETADVPLPLAKKVMKLTHFIAIATFAIAVLTFLAGIARGIEFREILGAVIGLSVSVVPEGLPVAVTIILAGGVWRMAKAHAIIRQMAAVEAMGNADCLLVDKTGTITTGKMNISKISFLDELFTVKGNGYDPTGKIENLEKSKHKEKILKMLSLTRLSLNAEIVYETDGGWQPRGDSTEAAIAVVCARAGLDKEKIEKHYKVDFAKPFDPKKRYIEGSFSKDGEKWHIFIGAPEFLSKNLKIDHGHICARTGDGVNDAPALQAAHLGIGLGSGTQVAKDSADIILVNDNFETIVAAIAEGRSIYLSLKKVILYLFSTSLGEVSVILGGVLLGLPLPLLAVQIIWLNFVTDGFFVVALSQDTPRRKLVSKDDVNSENLIDGLMVKRMIVMAIAMFVATMPFFIYFLDRYSLSYSRSVVLIVLAATQWFNAFNVRSRTLSVFKRKLDNKFLIAAFIAVLILQILVIETSFGNKIMHTENIKIEHWIMALLASTLIIWVEEARKMWGKVREVRKVQEVRKLALG